VLARRHLLCIVIVVVVIVDIVSDPRLWVADGTEP
jgi:hypothetical protein